MSESTRHPAVLAVIPARGGSKGIPLKNLREVAGRSLVARAVDVAMQAGCIDRIVVSTDHSDIAAAACGAGADVVMRPDELSLDASRTEACLLHVLDTLADRDGFRAELVVTLEPTSPLRTPGSIARCVELFQNREVDSVVSVVLRNETLGRIRNGRFEFLFPDEPRRRQDREATYAECGVAYGTRASVLRETGLVVGGRLYALVVDELESIDINTEADLQVAGLLAQQ